MTNVGVLRRPESAEDLAFADIAGLAARLAAGEISAVELARFFLDRLERLGGEYRAVRTLMTDRALSEAAGADRRLRGRLPPAEPALTGIPYGVKDLFAARGGPTSLGVPALRDHVISEDAYVVRALAKAGGVLVAKLSLTELVTFRSAERPHDAIDGAARNPWNPGRWTGGSSSGPAAAVAAGLVPFAIGTDAGGSISIPAAYCGVTGLRPSWRAVPDSGGLVITQTLDKSGPICRSAADCATVFEALVGGRPRDGGPWTRLQPHQSLRRDALENLVVGFHPLDFEEAAETAARPALSDGLRAVWDLGVQRQEIALPPGLSVRDPLRVIALVETAFAFRDLAASGTVDFESDPDERAGYHEALAIGGVDYLGAMASQRRISEMFQRMFEQVDVLVSFTAPTGAPPIESAFEPIPDTGGNTALLYAGILAGLPSLSVPCGLSSDGLPVGLQIVGPVGSDRLVLELGRAFQSGTDWHRMRPPAVP